MKNKDITALIITICAVITAMPRWVGALLASEGFVIPPEWEYYWLIASALFNAAMAVTEGAAFAYVFDAWRRQKDDKLLWLSVLSGLTFIAVLTPFIVTQVRGQTVNDTLSNDFMVWLWGIAVSASTIVIVASVGYAQGYTKDLILRQVDSLTKPIKELSTEQLQVLALDEEPSLISERQVKILNGLKTNTFNASAFASQEKVTPQTIYNDLKVLSEKELVTKNGKGWQAK